VGSPGPLRVADQIKRDSSAYHFHSGAAGSVSHGPITLGDAQVDLLLQRTLNVRLLIAARAFHDVADD
jgi:hypothetical protein